MSSQCKRGVSPVPRSRSWREANAGRASSLRPRAHGEFDDTFELFSVAPDAARTAMPQTTVPMKWVSASGSASAGRSPSARACSKRLRIAAWPARRGRDQHLADGRGVVERSTWCPGWQDSRPGCSDRSAHRRRRAAGPRRPRARSPCERLALIGSRAPRRSARGPCGTAPVCCCKRCERLATVDAHRLRELRERRPFVALGPKKTIIALSRASSASKALARPITDW